MTLEGCVVRISDVIAYIGRDIEDAIAIRLIKREQIPSAIREILGASNDQIINTLVLDLVKNSYGKEYLTFSTDIFKALDDLKKFNYEYIYFNPLIKTETPKIQTMFRVLFEKYLVALTNNKTNSIYEHFLNDMNTDYLNKTIDSRKVIDFMAGMTDDFFNNQYKELFVPQSYGYFVKNTEGLNDLFS
jgi:dGTPase